MLIEDKINSPAQGIKGQDNMKKKGFKSIQHNISNNQNNNYLLENSRINKNTSELV